MTEPTYFDPATTDPNTIATLAGKDWLIPPLVPLQLRTARSKIISLQRYLEGRGSTRTDETTGDRLIQMTDEQYGMMLEVIYLGLTRGYPSMTRQEFDELPIRDGDIYRAFLVIRDQSGIYKKADPAAPAPPPPPEGTPPAGA